MYTYIFNAINPNLRTHDTRTTQKLLNLISGIEHVRYDICKNHCVCYAGYLTREPVQFAIHLVTNLMENHGIRLTISQSPIA